MKHKAPIVVDENAGPGLNDVASRLIQAVAARNPLTAAIHEELSPEIDGVLREHLGNQHVNLKQVHEVAVRAHRIARKASERNA